jgi:hypothetical protein
MYKRTIEPLLTRFAEIYPAVGITGPRQSGKTTTARTLFGHLPYISLENMDTRFKFNSDPRGFLQNYLTGAIFDEVQHTPELLSYLQEIIDNTEQNGRFIITGSQNFSLSHSISQSLAGRIGMTTLLPLSQEELASGEEITTQIFRGWYPHLHKSQMTNAEFYSSYTQTYIERDLQDLKKITNLPQFQTFLKLCAGRVGQVINFSSLAQDCGISHNTAKEWLNILQASYIVFFLQPYYKNFSKRLIKMSKLYFYDTGLVCHLLGLENGLQLETHYLKGALYENLVILELLKSRLNKGLQPNIYFWRDKSGNEIDCIAEWGGELKAFEIKSSATFQPEFTKSLKYLIKISDQPIKPYLIYNGLRNEQYQDIQLIALQKNGFRLS